MTTLQTADKEFRCTQRQLESAQESGHRKMLCGRISTAAVNPFVGNACTSRTSHGVSQCPTKGQQPQLRFIMNNGGKLCHR